MRRLLAIILLVLMGCGSASAMRMGIGASQATRIDIGAAQASGDATELIRNGWWERRRHGKHHESFNRQLLDLSERVSA